MSLGVLGGLGIVGGGVDVLHGDVDLRHLLADDPFDGLGDPGADPIGNLLQGYRVLGDEGDGPS